MLNLIAPGSEAQVQTAIRTDNTLGTRVTQEGVVHTISGGTSRGTNLFHSFLRFTVGTGDTARFTTGQVSIDNIISRITGNQQSLIDGVLQSNQPNANIYLLNPNGIMFGPNARLDVNSSVHVSTADVLQLADGGQFHANLSAQSLLTVAPPTAFGFLQNDPNPIAIEGSTLVLPEAHHLSFVGGNIHISASTLVTPSGQIILVSAGGPGEVIHRVTDGEVAVGVDTLNNLGDIALSEATRLDASGDPGGQLVIRSGSLMIDATGLSADTLGATHGTEIAIDVDVSGDMVLTDGALLIAQTGGAGNAGDIQLTVEDFQMEKSSSIGSRTLAPGRSSDITINAATFTATDGSFIISLTSSIGQGGDVTVRATGNMTLSGETPDRAFVSSINTNTLSQGEQAGTSGHVSVQALNITLTDGANISSTTSGAGSGGHVRVEVADTLTVSGTTRDGKSQTGLGTQTRGRGDAGSVSVRAHDITVRDGGTILGTTFSSGRGGDLAIQGTGTIALSGAISNDRFTTGIGSNSQGSPQMGEGDAGHILVEARDIIIADGALIQSDSNNSGQGGNVIVRASDTITLSGIAPTGRLTGGISANAQGSVGEAGDAGMVLVEAKNISITGGAQITGVTFGNGRGGNVTVHATENLTLSGAAITPDNIFFSNIGASTQGFGPRSGDGGNVLVEGHHITLTDGGSILSEAVALGAGKSGNITVRATGTLTLKGSVPGRDFPNSVSSISSQTGSLNPRRPDGGDILVEAQEISIRGGAQIAANTQGAANGGRVILRATGSVSISGATPNFQLPSGISATTRSRLPTAGDGGDILVEAPTITIRDGAVVSAASSGMGRSGQVTLLASEVVTITGQDSAILTLAQDSGPGGNIMVDSRVLQLLDGATISSQSMAAGNAGSIVITNRDTFLSEKSTMTTEAERANGGEIEIHARTIRLLESEITAEARGIDTDTGSDGGNVSLQAERIALNRSQIQSNAFGGSGGDITVQASGIFLADATTCSNLTCMNASSELSVDGTIDVQSPVTNLSAELTSLPEGFGSSGILMQGCAERWRSRTPGQFVTPGRDGLPAHPGRLRPSFMRHGLQQQDAATSHSKLQKANIDPDGLLQSSQAPLPMSILTLRCGKLPKRNAF